MKQHISLSGQFQIIKKNADNQVLYDSGTLHNLLLDTGLDYFGDNTGYTNILQYLAIGTGNSEPIVTQNRLDNVVAIKGGSYHSQKDDYNAEQDGEYFTASRTYKYSFENLDNVNVSELGLVNNSNKLDYTAYTRALIKDDTGRPLVITVLQGEILEIFYTLKQVYHLQDKQFKIALSNGRGGQRGNVDCLMRLCGVGGLNIGGSASYGGIVGNKLKAEAGNNSHVAFDSQTLGKVTEQPQGTPTYVHYASSSKADYVPRSYKNTLTLTITEHYDLTQLGAIIFLTTMGFYQISFSNEGDNSMIDKNNKRTFSITLEISWGRDERG